MSGSQAKIKFSSESLDKIARIKTSLTWPLRADDEYKSTISYRFLTDKDKKEKEKKES